MLLGKAFAHIKKKMAPMERAASVGSAVTSEGGAGGSPTRPPSSSSSIQDMAYSVAATGGSATTNSPAINTDRKFSAGTDSLTSASTQMSGGGGGAARSRRRASMQDALDHTKINASLYDQDSLRQQQSFDGMQEESHGSLQLALRYNIDQELLTVRIIQARDLCARYNNSAAARHTAHTNSTPRRHNSTTTNGSYPQQAANNSTSASSSLSPAVTLNPYCKVSVNPVTTVSHVTTKVRKDTFCPYYDEEFLFEVPADDVISSKVRVCVMNHDSSRTKHDCVGVCTVALETVDLSESEDGGTVTLWKNIAPYRKDQEQMNCGEVMFSMTYLPSAERLTVVVQKARNLKPPDDGKNTANPYIKASLLCAGGLKRLKKKKTSTKRSCLNPEWNEALAFSVGREQLRAGGVYLEISVQNDVIIPGMNNDSLGKVALGTGGTLGGGVGGLCGSEEVAHWTDMINASAVTARWHRLRPPDNAAAS